jgi:hypothetical protein
MSEASIDTVLIVCDDEKYSADLISALVDGGSNVVGPVSRANMALALAAQTSPTVAIVARPPTGRRDATALARELMDTWGVRSLVLEAAQPEGVPPEARPWEPAPGEFAGLRAALARMNGAPLV